MAGSPSDWAAKAPTISPGWTFYNSIQHHKTLTLTKCLLKKRVLHYAVFTQALYPNALHFDKEMPVSNGSLWKINHFNLTAFHQNFWRKSSNRIRNLSLNETGFNFSQNPLKCLCREMKLFDHALRAESRSNQDVHQQSGIDVSSTTQSIFAFHDQKLLAQISHTCKDKAPLKL